MRGKAKDCRPHSDIIGITPAYAGKRHTNPLELLFRSDHPRLCGEKKFIFIKKITAFGSPPPMRGKAAFVAFNIVTIRITPAYAGKSIPVHNNTSSL